LPRDLLLGRWVLLATACAALVLIGFDLGSHFPTRTGSTDVISALQLSTLGAAFAE
jgi:hypothetical protein